MPKLLKSLSEDPDLADKYAAAFAQEARLSEACIYTYIWTAQGAQDYAISWFFTLFHGFSR